MIRFSALTAMVIGVIAWPAPGSNPTLGANAADWTSRPEWQYCAGAAVSNSGQIFCECGFSSQLQLQCVVEDEESRKSHVNAIFNLHFGDANDEILGISPGDAVYHDVDQANRENVVSFQVGDFHLDDWVIMNFNQHDQTVYFEYPVALDHPLLDALASGAMLEVRTHASSAASPSTSTLTRNPYRHYSPPPLRVMPLPP